MHNLLPEILRIYTWIYEHFPMIPNATPNPSYDHSQPRICMQKNMQFDGDHAYALTRLREQLDLLLERDVSIVFCFIPVITNVGGLILHLNCAMQVMWNPYSEIRDRYRLEEYSFYIRILSCFDVAEPYYPNRVTVWF